jgi:hypothetical protein
MDKHFIFMENYKNYGVPSFSIEQITDTFLKLQQF